MAMTVKIQGDRTFGPGCAWLEISAAVPPDVTYRISCSNSQKPHVGPVGWQSAPYEWRPRKIIGTRTGTRLLVGPEIVDRVHEDMQIRVEIPSTGYTAEAFWPDIPVSAVRDQARLDGPAGPNDLPPLPQRPQPATPNVTVPVPPAPPDVAEEEASDSGPDRPSPLSGIFSRFLSGATGKRLGLATVRTALVLSGLAFLLFAGLGYAYVEAGRLAPTAPPPQTLAAQGEETVRLLLEGERQPERLFSLGLQLHGTPGASRDLGLHAIRRASEHGHLPALLWLARTADPSRPEWQGVARAPNAARALPAYDKAARAGSAEAPQFSKNLCDRLRSQADSAVETRARDTFC
jgi:hypothetical protein